MKLARYDAGAGPRIVLVRGDGIVDLAAAGARWTTMMEIIAAGPDAIDAIASIAARNNASVRLDSVRLLAPIERPGNYLAIGMNYAQHREEADKLGIARTQHQLWFNKQTSCLSGPFDPIEPGVTEKLDYEVELGVVIGKAAKSVAEAEAQGHIFG